MTQRPYPQIISENPVEIAKVLREIVRIRDEDIGNFDALSLETQQSTEGSFYENGLLQLQILDEPFDHDTQGRTTGQFISTGTNHAWAVIGGHNNSGLLEGSVLYTGDSLVHDSITIRVCAKGTSGQVHFVANGYGQASVGGGPRNASTDAQLANYVALGGQLPGANPSISAQRSDVSLSAAFGLTFYTIGTGSHLFQSSNTTVTQLEIAHTASGVNYHAITPGATTVGPTLSAKGETNVDLRYATKGTGGHTFLTNSTVQQFGIGHVATAVNYLVMTGAVAGSRPTVTATGSDSNIGVNFIVKGTGLHNFRDDSGAGSIHLQLGGTTGVVNYIAIVGGTTGNPPSISSQGTDAAKGLLLYTAGTGDIDFKTNNTSQQGFEIKHTASSVNYLSVTGGVTGSPGTATMSCIGSDSNIDMVLTPKGSGVLKVGTAACFTANGSVATSVTSVGPTGAQTTVQEWLTVKNSSGTVRYIPAF